MLLSSLLVVAAPKAQEPTPGIDHALAARCFAEAEAISARDDGALWGVPLAGPMLFVVAATRELVANRADAQGLLERRGELYTGRLPADVNAANTACEWAGRRWTMVLWPLPDDALDRATLMAHELFHRIQPELGLPLANPTNAHLDTRDGRIWMRLELSALVAALRSAGDARLDAVRDALAFRRQRHALTPAAAEEERQLELNEGLAEYTGRRLAQIEGAQRCARLAEHLEGHAFLGGTLMRSFAYLTGPAYGLLLDEQQSDWRAAIDADADLAVLAQRAFTIGDAALADLDVAAASKRHGGGVIRRQESQRDAARQTRLGSYRLRYVEGATARFSLAGDTKYQFDPTNLEAFGDHGTVYPTLRVVAPWGILEVEGGALIDPAWKSVVVPAPADAGARVLEGAGWKATLNDGVRAVAGSRPGDWTIE